MEIGTVKISVDTTELDNATEKLTSLSKLLDKVQGQLDLLSGKKTVNMSCQVVSALDYEEIKNIFKHDHNIILSNITKSTLR